MSCLFFLLSTTPLTPFPSFSQARSDKQHLRILLDELGPAPAQVPRKENRTVELPLYSRWEMPIQDITTALMAENNVTQNDILYMETKSIFVQLIRSIPQLAERRPVVLPGIAERAATAKDATLVRKGIKVKEMLRELEELKLVDRRDSYKLLTDEVTNELIHLGNLREKVVLETRSLEAVFKTIGDHNNYLRSQLEQYKAYLQNVRQTSGGKGKSSGVGVVSVAGKDSKPQKSQLLGPFKYSVSSLFSLANLDEVGKWGLHMSIHTSTLNLRRTVSSLNQTSRRIGGPASSSLSRAYQLRITLEAN